MNRRFVQLVSTVELEVGILFILYLTSDEIKLCSVHTHIASTDDLILSATILWWFWYVKWEFGMDWSNHHNYNYWPYGMRSFSIDWIL